MIGKECLPVLLAVLGLAAAGMVGATASADMSSTSVPFQGKYVGYDSGGDDLSGTFVDWGTYSLFEGTIETTGTYEFVEVPTDEYGGYYTTHYTISDDEGNSLEFVGVEVMWMEYAQGSLGLAQSEWEIVGGQGVYEGATGSGLDRTWFNLEDMSYWGTMSGTIHLN